MMVQSVALTVAALLAITGYTRIVDPSFILPANIFWSYSRWSPPPKKIILLEQMEQELLVLQIRCISCRSTNSKTELEM